MTDSHVLVICRNELARLEAFLPPSIITRLHAKLSAGGLSESSGENGQASTGADPFLSLRIASKDAEIVAGVRHAVFETGYTLGLGRLSSLSPEKRLCFFDMDATLVAEESIVELARAAGKTKEVEAITVDAMAGRIDFFEALKARLKILKGLPADALESVVGRITINPGIEAFARLAGARGIKSYVVSGGFTDFAEPLARQLGFVKAFAHQLRFDNGFFTGEISGDVIDADRKAIILEKEVSRTGRQLADSVAVGDGANDLKMMQIAGLAVGYRPKEVLFPFIDAANFHGDHRFLIHLLAIGD